MNHAIMLARRCVTTARIAVGVLTIGLVVANAISSFSPDTSSLGSGEPFKFEIVRFLSSILLALGIFAAVLLLSVFASIYVEGLALKLMRPESAPVEGDPASIVSIDDSRWRK